MKSISLGTLLSAAFTLLAVTGLAERPNIMVIMADDLGYSDIGCYGAEIDTPVLDALAGGGIRFTQFYNAGRCSPSRASILTGLYPHQAGVGAMMLKTTAPAYRGYLNNHCITLGEAMQLNGYHTISSGKWHVCADEENNPYNRGFDRSFFTPGGAGNFYTVGGASGKINPVKIDGKDVMPWDDYYDTDAVFDLTIRFLKERPKDRPFFAYITPRAPHWPLHAKPEDIAKYQGTYDSGWDELREQRLKKQIDSGLISKQWNPAQRSDGDGTVPAWDTLTPKQQKEMAAKMAVYAAQIDSLDQNIGKLVDYLKDEQLFDNTLILFLSDNGACAEPDDNPLGRDWKNGKGGPLGSADSFQSYGQAWAEVSNTPYRFWKQRVHEGGISTPFIASWPNGITVPGTFNRDVGHIVDIMATCIELSGGSYPETYKGEPILPMAGISLLPAFQGLEKQNHDQLAWEHFANRGIRIGKWKLVSYRRNLWLRGTPGPWELYDMENDRTESNDLAQRMPEKVEELTAAYTQWASEIGVVEHVKDWRTQRVK